MKKTILLFFLSGLCISVFAQEPRTRIKRDSGPFDPIVIKLSHPSLEIFLKGESVQLSAWVESGRGETNIVWSSANPKVANVDAAGMVSPVSLGKTIIKASTSAGLQSTPCEVTVSKGNYWGNSNAALADGGMVTAQNDWIYYANPYDSLKLYKINLNGTGKTKLSNDKPALINVVGRNIYYQNTDERTKKGFYKIDVDGTQRTLINDLDYMSYLRVCEHSIVYLNQDYEVYRLLTKMTDRPKQKFFDEQDEITSIAFDDYYVYYTKWWEKMRQPGNEMGGLYIYDIKEKNKVRLIPPNAIITKFTEGNDGWIYYSQNGSNTSMLPEKIFGFTVNEGGGDPVAKGLFRRNLGSLQLTVNNSSASFPKNEKSKEALKIEPLRKGDPFAYWTVCDNWIYYIEHIDWGTPKTVTLRRMQTDGKKDQKVTDVVVSNKVELYPAGNYILLVLDDKLIRMLQDGRNAMELN